MTSRRAFILGLTSALAAPAIVREESLMRVAMLRESVVPKMLNEENLLEVFIDLSERRLITECWAMGYDMWRRVYFDDARQEVISEQVLHELPFVLYGGPPGGSMADA